jgi:hypothetical protein
MPWWNFSRSSELFTDAEEALLVEADAAQDWELDRESLDAEKIEDLYDTIDAHLYIHSADEHDLLSDLLGL